MHFIYLGNKGGYCIFKMCCLISVLFFTKHRLFHVFVFLFSNNTFSINHVLKFNIHCDHLKVNVVRSYRLTTELLSHWWHFCY